MTDKIRVKGKICLLGDLAVGKTSLIRRYVLDTFDDKYITTIGTKVTKKRLDIELPEQGKEVDLTLLIWDIMGQYQERLSSTISQFDRYIPQQNYFYNSKGAIIVSDLTRKSTCESAKVWISSLFEVTGEVPVIIIGNKNDLKDKHEVKKDELGKIAKKYNAPSFLTSAKTGYNVEKMFYHIGEQLVKSCLSV
jgi:small GTP-binding protein